MRICERRVKCQSASLHSRFTHGSTCLSEWSSESFRGLHWAWQTGPWARSVRQPISAIKFYWNTSTLTHLYIAYECFHPTTAELRRYTTGRKAHTAWNIYYPDLYRTLCRPSVFKVLYGMILPYRHDSKEHCSHHSLCQWSAPELCSVQPDQPY